MTNTETVSTERLEKLAKGYETWGKTNSAQPQIDLDTASALRELLAIRTQSPAEWQELQAAAQNVYDKLAGELTTVDIFDQERLGDALRAASIPVPERPKEETGKLAEARRRMQEKLDYFDAEVAEEIANENERADLWMDIEVLVDDLRTVLSALETPPLHKEGEDELAIPGARKRVIGTIAHIDHGKTSLTAAVTRIIAAESAAPVPVPLEDGLVEIIEQSDTPDGGTALTLRQYDQETVVVAYFPPVLPPAPVPVTVTDEEVRNGARGIWDAGETGLPFEMAPPSLVRGLMNQSRACLTAALSQKPGEQG
jgi:hypothetical protein